MATPQDYALSNLRDNAQAMMQNLEQVNRLRNRIAQELLALTVGTPTGLDAFFNGYSFPNGYTADDIKALFVALAGNPANPEDNGLPGSIVPDDVRDELFKLLSCVWETFA